MMTRTLQFLAPAIIVALMALPAIAEAGPGADRAFQRLDADADGTVTTAEVVAHKTALFTEADANADGLLNAEEREAMRNAVRERMNEQRVPFDTDGDGNLSLAEFTSANALFDHADSNGDGSITRAEFDAAVPKFRN
jgi:Ca2+-binding EF-hand superfamily protein